MSFAIETQALTKHYRIGRGEPPLRAVDGIDFTVLLGEVFGFLGPNSAGKSTTIRMLPGLAKPTSGSAHVLGLDLLRDTARIKKLISMVPEVKVSHPQARVTHEAAIGSVDEREIEALMARGLDPDAAVYRIILGMLV